MAESQCVENYTLTSLDGGERKTRDSSAKRQRYLREGFTHPSGSRVVHVGKPGDVVVPIRGVTTLVLAVYVGNGFRHTFVLLDLQSACGLCAGIHTEWQRGSGKYMSFSQMV